MRDTFTAGCDARHENAFTRFTLSVSRTLLHASAQVVSTECIYQCKILQVELVRGPGTDLHRMDCEQQKLQVEIASGAAGGAASDAASGASRDSKWCRRNTIQVVPSI